MDLATIRKKAKQAKEAAITQPPAAPAAPETSDDAAATAPAPPAQDFSATDAERLERLFALPGEVEVASEECYLQGLQGRDQGAQEDSRQWLTFVLGPEEYALEIDQVKEIIKPRPVTEIPRVPDFIQGVISLRGVIVPVFDLRRRLGLEATELTAASRIIVCRNAAQNTGLLVDRISQVLRIPADVIEPPPAVLAGVDRELVAGVGRQRQRMFIQLDLPNVLNPELV